MNKCRRSRLSTFDHKSASRSWTYRTRLYWGMTIVLLSLLFHGSFAFGQTSLSPATVSFGNLAVGVASAPKNATLKNQQAVPLKISSIAISGGTAPGDYSWAGNCPISPSTLGVGMSCTITVTFTPSAIGSRTATLTVLHNATTSPQSVALVGTSSWISIEQ